MATLFLGLCSVLPRVLSVSLYIRTMEEEFDNFMEKVTEIEDLVQKLRSPDAEVADRAKRRADLLLRVDGYLDLLDSRADSTFCTKDRTLINQKAFETLGRCEDPAEMSKEAFMAQVERDAENRAREKKERRKRSDDFSSKGNKAFREQKFEKALELFNKAIDETRDRCFLYENRALTCLKLELYRRAVDDCDWALRLNDNSLKALLYKAKGQFLLGEMEAAEDCIKQASEKHPQQVKLIEDFRAKWEVRHKN